MVTDRLSLGGRAVRQWRHTLYLGTHRALHPEQTWITLFMFCFSTNFTQLALGSHCMT